MDLKITTARISSSVSVPVTDLLVEWDQHTAFEILIVVSISAGWKTPRNTLPNIATHCNTLQHTATHCNILKYTETYCNTLPHTATHCNTLQHTATHCNTLQHTATHCNTLQHRATHCNALKYTATPCNTLQHSATPCNTLQHAYLKEGKRGFWNTLQYTWISEPVTCDCRSLIGSKGTLDLRKSRHSRHL